MILSFFKLIQILKLTGKASARNVSIDKSTVAVIEHCTEMLTRALFPMQNRKDLILAKKTSTLRMDATPNSMCAMAT